MAKTTQRRKVSKTAPKKSKPVAPAARAVKRKTSPKPAPKRRATALAKARPMFDRVAFTMFQVQDATRARSFYEDVLGLTRGLASPDGVWTEYDLPGGGCLALLRHPGGDFAPSGGAALAFEVADLDALNARLQAAGVRYLGGVVRGPHCRMSNILDSEGNGLVLHQLDRR